MLEARTTPLCMRLLTDSAWASGTLARASLSGPPWGPCLSFTLLPCQC